MQIDRAIHEARAVCVHLGHAMRRFTHFTLMNGLPAASSECSACGAYVQCESEGLIVRAGGSAVDSRCLEKSSSNYDQGLCLMSIRWREAILAGEYPPTFKESGEQLCSNPLPPDAVLNLRKAQMCEECLALSSQLVKRTKALTALNNTLRQIGPSNDNA